MKKNQGKMAVYATLLTLGLSASYMLQSSAQDEDLLENRIWIDRIPDSPQVLVNGRVFLEGEYYYQIQQSGFRNYTDLCIYEDQRGDHGRLDVQCLHLEDMHMFTKTSECDDAPDPFEYCLEMTVNDKTKRYYSMPGLEVEPGDSIHGKLFEFFEF